MSCQALKELCEVGQALLEQTRYLEAESTLAQAEQQAWVERDWDALSRLYMPLQETRRQRRQRCGEGMVCLDLLAESPQQAIDAEAIVGKFPAGQLLVGAWGSIEPALRVRKLAAQRGLYLETFLAAVYPLNDGEPAVVILPSADMTPPAADRGLAALPVNTLVLPMAELPRGSRQGTTQTYAQVMALWERLHLPFLVEADRQSDPIQRMQGYRRAIEVDYACELAHQKLSDVARGMLRRQ